MAHLKGVSRKAQQNPTHEPSRAHLQVHVNSDWAGDTVTRRNTSGVIARTWTALAQTQLNVQNVIGLSTAESEHHAPTKDYAQNWMCKTCVDWNLKLQLTLQILRVRKQSSRGIGKGTHHIDEDAVATSVKTTPQRTRFRDVKHTRIWYTV